MNFYPNLLEKITRRQEKSAIKTELLNKFPEKYSGHSSAERVKNSGEVEIEEFQKDIEDVSNDLELDIKKTEVVPPGRFNPKASSDTYDTVYIEFADEERDPTGMVLTRLEGRGKTSTEFKEGIVCFFFNSQKEYEPIKKGVKDTEAQYYQLMEAIINEIESKGIKGISNPSQDEILKFLKNKSAKYDLNVLNSILNGMSIGNWLRNSQFSNWSIKRDAFFDNVKKTCAKELNMQPDKWNPMDIMLVKPGKDSEIWNRIEEAREEENRDLKLGKINSIFIDKLDSENEENLAISISLKEAEAQSGKAKSYLENIEFPEDIEYNITSEEKSWFGNNQKIKREIEKVRKSIKTLLTSEDLLNYFDYKLGKGGIKGFDGRNFLGKYGSLKMLQFLLKHTTPKENIFIDLASYGLSLGSNPAFFKIAGNIEGDKNKVENNIQIFPVKGGVSLYDKIGDNYDGKIWIIDNNQNSGVNVIYWVVFSSMVYIVRVEIRANKTNRNAQVVIEIKDFKKVENLSETFYPRF